MCNMGIKILNEAVNERVKVNADTKCDLRAIFQTPPRRNYDELQILERSSFLPDPQQRSSQSPCQNNRVNSASPNTAPVLLSLGDYVNAIRKNNNNVNTKITLAGPNHNTYIQPPCVNPYYVPNILPRRALLPHQYYIVQSRPSSPVDQSYQIPDNIHYPERPHFVEKPRFVIEEPILFKTPVIQHIPQYQPTDGMKKPSSSNGLNTMTAIPKILIDTVVKDPGILEKIGSTESANDTEPPSQNDNLKIIQMLQNNNEGNAVVSTSTENGQEVSTCTDDQTNPGENETLPSIQIVELNSPLALGESKNVDETNKETTVLDVVEDNTQDIIEGVVVQQQQEVYIPPENTPIHNCNHPRILHPVKLSGDIENVEIVGAGTTNISLLNNLPQLIVKNCSNTKDLELVNLLQKSLVPFINLKTNDPTKYLVSYPVINYVDKNIPEHLDAIYVQAISPEPIFCSHCASNKGKNVKKADIDGLALLKSEPVSLRTLLPSASVLSSGYSVSSGSGFYEDPTKKIVYNDPTTIRVFPSQTSNFLIAQTNDNINSAPIVYQQPPQVTNPYEVTKLLDLLKYLLSIPSTARLLENYYSRPPTKVKCPHCLNDHDIVVPTNPIPISPSFPYITPFGSPLYTKPSTRCPYCSKYSGELNQLI